MTEDPFDNYLLFTNRKNPANKDHEIITRIKNEVGISNVDVIGKEQLGTYITDEIADQFDLKKYILPFRFYEKDIQEVILLFHNQQASIAIDTSEITGKFDHLSKKDKNNLNRLTEGYFKYIKSHSLQHFAKIESFLKDPRNLHYANFYNNTISDLQGKIIIKRSDFAAFDEVIEHVSSIILESNFEKLKDYRRLIRVFVHFMYWQCDIGAKE